MLDKKLYSAFKDSLKNVDKHQKIALAVSGGADSMAMLLVAKMLSKSDASFNFIAITVDHNLRTQSADEAFQVATWCGELNIEYKILKWEDPLTKGNLQANARQARYKLMSDYCKTQEINTLYVAHNIDDQCETVLMRVLRGSGLDGLSGISSLASINDIKIVRPFLNVYKDELKQFLEDNNQPWIEDSSNNNEDFQRVGIRKIIDKYYDKNLIIKRISQTANHLQRTKSYIEHKLIDDIKTCVELKPEGYIKLNKSNFINLHEEAQLRILSKILKLISTNSISPRFKKLQNLHENIKNNKISQSQTFFGCVIENDNDNYLIYREISAIEKNPYTLKPNEEILWDKRFFIKNSSQKTLQIIPLEPANYLKYLKNNLNYKIPNINKKIIYTLPALFYLEKLVSIPQIKYYEDEAFKEQIFCDFYTKLY